MSEVRVVNAGIDTLKVNVRYVDELGLLATKQLIPDDLLALLHDWQEKAKVNSEPFPTSMTFNNARLMMLPNGAQAWTYIVKNDCIQVSIAPRLKIPMVAKVTFASPYLWSVATTQDAVEEVHSFLMDVFGSRVMVQAAQIDMCADVVGLAIPSEWREVFISRARSKHEIGPTEKDRAYYRGRKLETLNFSGHGRPVSCKLYDKRMEIEQRSPGKKFFYVRWTHKGWDGEADVWRVEFSVEREGLHEMELEDIYLTLRNVKRLWAYCSQEWLRMVTPGDDSNRTRWETAPGWVEIQHAFDDFGDPSLDALGPLVREHKRNADIEQLTAQIAGCSTTLAALLNDTELVPDADAPELLSVVTNRVVKRWHKLQVIPQDVVREKKFLHHQAG